MDSSSNRSHEATTGFLDTSFVLGSNEVASSYYGAPPTSGEVAPSYFELPSVFRSVGIMAPTPVQFDSAPKCSASPFSLSIEPPSLKRDSVQPALESCDIFSKLNSQKPSSSSRSSVHAPELPDYLLPNHFEVSYRAIELLIIQINTLFKETAGISYHFVESDCEWKAVYLNGSAHCKLQVNIYSSRPDIFIVEGNRLSGDGSLFRSIYDRIKARLTPSASPRDGDSFASAMPPMLAVGEPEIDVEAALEPIVRMARESKMEAQLEASRSFCDLSVDEAMQPLLCENGCIPILLELISHSHSDWAKQHAMLALANLSDNAVCQYPMIVAGALPVLVKLSQNGPFENAEMRRLAAHALANVSKRLAEKVVQQLGQEVVRDWMDTVSDLSDERLKLQADRAKESLSLVF